MNRRFSTLIGSLFVAWVAFAPAVGLAADDSPFTGTWSGSFEIHFADGRVVNDTAWLVLQQAGKTVTGSAGPKLERQSPIQNGAASGDQLTFETAGGQGKVLKVMLKREGERLRGAANGEMGPDKVRIVMDLASVGSSGAPPDPLYLKVLALDTEMFEAFNTCTDPVKLEKHASFFVKELEFYHDNGGASFTRDEYMKGVHDNVCGKFHRELVTESFRVWPIKGYGAISQGTHRFCHSPTTCEGVGQFTMIWREKDGKWEVTRAMSYDHKEEHVAAKGR